MNGTYECWAIIPAAGIGRRFGSGTPKQYFQVAAKSVLQHSIDCVLSAPQIKAAVVCVAEDDPFWEKQPSSQASRVHSIIGGASRAKSVSNGIEFLATKAQVDDWVLVHDAVRPLLPEASLQNLIGHCYETQRGAILASAVVDTLKQVDAQERVLATLDRSSIWQAETPQMFRFGELRSALSSALAANINITDEASAMELAGYPIDVVASKSNNFKLTTREDLPLLEFLMQAKHSNIDV